MKNNKVKLCLALAIILLSCTLSRTLPRENPYPVERGTYTSEANTRKIVIGDDSFIFVDVLAAQNPAIDDCCDTIINGSWTYVEGAPFIVVNDTPSAYHSDEAYFEVQELIDLDRPDSIVVEIINPVENYARTHRRGRSLLHYDLGVNATPQSFSVALSNVAFEQGKAIIAKPTNSTIIGFDLTISITPAVYLNSVARTKLYTRSYVPQNKEANTFRITLPNLSLSRFVRGGHTADYIQIKSPKALLWDGVIYMAQ